MVLFCFSKLASNYHIERFYYFSNENLLINAITVSYYKNVGDSVVGYV